MFEDYFLVGLFGLVVGASVTRLFFKSNLQRKKMGEVIEWAMVEKTISQLDSMTTILNRLVADIKSNAEELTEKLQNAYDIEPKVKEGSKI